MNTAARYLWHQRLAWLLMIYVAAMGLAVAGTAAALGAVEVFGQLLNCAVIMTCVKDSALRGRPMPYSWRLPMIVFWPVAVFLVEWRARRWLGLVWVALHGFVLFAAAICTAVFIEIVRHFV